MEKLAALQDSLRLGIHMVETEESRYSLHAQTLSDFDAVPAEQIRRRLQSNMPSLFSMSLLPRRSSGVTLCPYGVNQEMPSNYGYLFDLSQDQPNPPRVVRAFHGTLSSGPSRINKNMQMSKSTLPALNQFYERYASDEYGDTMWARKIIMAIGAERNGTLTEHQLDALGAGYAPVDPQIEAHDGIVGFNEILVAASTPHIAAITVPYMQRAHATPEQQAYYTNSVRLQAALVGLDHLAHGMHLPVVIYHVDGPEQGAMSYLGQEEQELKKVALEALSALGPLGLIEVQEWNKMKQFDNLPSDAFENGTFDAASLTGLYEMDITAKKYLGVDLTAPISGPDSWPEQVKTKLAELTVAPAPSQLPHQTSPASGGR